MIDDKLTREERLELEDDGFVVSHPEHESCQRVTIEDWDHVVARVTGISDSLGDGTDGIDLAFKNFVKEEHAVVEILVKGEKVAKLVHVQEDHG